MSERSKGARFFGSLDSYDKYSLGDELVLGLFDWRDWLLEKPSQEFMRGVVEASDAFEA
jgi:hypothetical protein